MNINTIVYLFKDAFKGMKKDAKNSFILLGTMFATMLLIAVAYLVYMNENKIITETKDKSSNMVAYIDVECTDEQAQKIVVQVEAIQGVTSTTYRDKDYAIELAKSMNPIMVEGFDDDTLRTIYPAYIVINFDDVNMVETINYNLSKISGIEEIEVNQYAREKAKSAEISKLIAVTAVVYIIEFSVLLMMNITKMMMYAKRREISIMKYVGARNNFIRAPFAIQGVFVAILAVSATLIVVSIAYPAFISQMNTLESGFSFISLDNMFKNLTGILLFIGVMIGLVGSAASMNKYLDV